MLDEELVSRAQRIRKASSTSAVLELALKEMIRRDSLKQLAQTLRTPSSKEEPTTAAPRRRSV